MRGVEVNGLSTPLSFPMSLKDIPTFSWSLQLRKDDLLLPDDKWQSARLNSPSVPLLIARDEYNWIYSGT
jgi:hypothetical protein